MNLFFSCDLGPNYLQLIKQKLAAAKSKYFGISFFCFPMVKLKAMSKLNNNKGLTTEFEVFTVWYGIE